MAAGGKLLGAAAKTGAPTGPIKLAAGAVATTGGSATIGAGAGAADTLARGREGASAAQTEDMMHQYKSDFKFFAFPAFLVC